MFMKLVVLYSCKGPGLAGLADFGLCRVLVLFGSKQPLVIVKAGMFYFLI